ncbi:hypothetical protein FB45DRAFT_1086289 [Roridomyces roridus]|uniref:Uncharacterized protein n=1 Tax=Roridomyces roridus TaxID=1738132 RepID=A0AAD7FHE1_9AGAR|nr:hypothetical protein FB45DRAFT_1086289 [Roridomyces roridus]
MSALRSERVSMYPGREYEEAWSRVMSSAINITHPLFVSPTTTTTPSRGLRCLPSSLLGPAFSGYPPGAARLSMPPPAAQQAPTPSAPPDSTPKRRSYRKTLHSKHHKHHNRHSRHGDDSRTPLATVNSTEDQLRELTEALDHEKRKRRKAEKRARKARKAQSATSGGNATSPSVADGSIERPRQASKVPMSMIPSHLGYDKPKWNEWLPAVHSACIARCSPGLVFRLSQDSTHLGAVWNVVIQEDAFPEAKRFKNLWGIERVAKQYWDSVNNYQRDMQNPNSYRRLHAADRTSQQVPDRSPSPTPSTSAPTAGLARPHPRRIDSSDAESESEHRAGGDDCGEDVDMRDDQGGNDVESKDD